MTNREFYNTIANTETLPEDLRNFALDAIAKLDNTNEKRKAAAATKAAEKQAEKAPVRETLFNILLSTDEPMTATELIEAADLGDAIKGPASIPSLLRPFVEDGRVVKVEKKITGKGKQRAYTCA